MRSRIHTLPLAAFALAGLALAALPGHATAQQEQRQFSGYIPGRCAVASRVIDGINRHDRRDTTRFTPERDTLFSATTASLRTCEAAYGGATTEPTEVLTLARVQLLTAQDAAAIATARRHLGTTASRLVLRGEQLHARQVEDLGRLRGRAAICGFARPEARRGRRQQRDRDRRAGRTRSGFYPHDRRDPRRRAVRCDSADSG